jgi:two-component system, LytTR family, response regulator
MLKSIIIDVERKSQEDLRTLICENVNGVSVEALCRTVAEGLEAIKRHKPDIVFLDVQMNRQPGFEALRQLGKVDFEIIFTTINDDRTISSTNFWGADHLLKPIDISDLKLTIKKAARNKLGKINKRLSVLQNQHATDHDNSRIALPTSDGLVFLPVNDILYCQASSNYTIFVTTEGKQYVVCKTLKEYEEVLLNYNFFRIHHSYVINLNRIQKYVKGNGGYVILNNNVSLDVSKRKKSEFLNRLLRAM